jgi:hypothetical protein
LFTCVTPSNRDESDALAAIDMNGCPEGAVDPANRLVALLLIDLADRWNDSSNTRAPNARGTACLPILAASFVASDSLSMWMDM